MMKPKPNPKLEWPIAYEAVLEVAASEGCRLKAYRCSAGVPTIGWGHTRGVKMGDTCTQEQADAWLVEDLTEFTDRVKRALKREASENELWAMVSFAFNVGMGTADGKVKGFLTSTVLRMHNAGDRQAAARAFGLWNKARVNGKLQVVAGLTLRRARESALYLTPDEGAYEPMPQKVEAESSLVDSPIAQSGVISVVGGVVAAASAALDPVKDIAATLNVEPLMVFGALGIIVGLIVLTQRNKQRSEGWA